MNEYEATELPQMREVKNNDDNMHKQLRKATTFKHDLDEVMTKNDLGKSAIMVEVVPDRSDTYVSYSFNVVIRRGHEWVVIKRFPMIGAE